MISIHKKVGYILSFLLTSCGCGLHYAVLGVSLSIGFDGHKKVVGRLKVMVRGVFGCEYLNNNRFYGECVWLITV
jgi:hypothetical protein